MIRVHRSFVDAVFLGLLLLIGINTLLYTARAASPLIVADAWRSVDSVVSKAASGELAVSDLFAKHGRFDHSQPLRKLILLFHYRWFDLDYSIEAIIGVLAAFVNLGLFWWMLRAPRVPPASGAGAMPSVSQRDPASPLQWLGFSALAAVYLSLNAAVIFNWPLLTLNYTSHFFVLMFLCAAWYGYRRADAIALSGLFAAALAMDLVSDDTGLATTLAAVLTIGVHAWRERRLRAAWQATAVVLGAYVVYRGLYAWITADVVVKLAPTYVDLGGRLARVSAHAGDLLHWVSVPLVAALAHRGHLRIWFGGDTAGIEALIALLMACAHAWFWWRALRGQRNLASFAATALMLLFYGLVAATVIARISLHGSEYLWQPRYVLIYELQLIALLLMALGQIARNANGEADDARPSRMPGAGRIAFAIAAVLLLSLQVPLSLHAWRGLKDVSAYQQGMASTLGALARDPDTVPENCAPQLLICHYDAQRREEVIRFLQIRHLNVFSPEFRARNRLYPSAIPEVIPDADALP